jgi:hypothetical protein
MENSSFDLWKSEAESFSGLERLDDYCNGIFGLFSDEELVGLEVNCNGF